MPVESLLGALIASHPKLVWRAVDTCDAMHRLALSNLLQLSDVGGRVVL
jgi:hypothetical protein